MKSSEQLEKHINQLRDAFHEFEKKMDRECSIEE